MLLLPGVASAMGSLSGYCTNGGQIVLTNGIPSTTQVQQSYPQCSITAFNTGGPSGSVTTAGTAVAWAGGLLFNANGQWAGQTMTINGTPYTISTCASNISCTLSGSAGTQSSPVPYTLPATAPAAIFTANGTALANPFVSTQQGYWQFYASNGKYDIQASGGGFPSPVTWGSQDLIDPATVAGSVTPQQFGAFCDNAHDDTTALTNAFNNAILTARQLLISGFCAVSSVVLTPSAAVSVLCADPQTSGFSRVTASLQASTPLVKITYGTASDLTVQNCGWLEYGNGTNYTNAASDLYVQNGGSTHIINNYCTLAQSNCVLYGGVGPFQVLGGNYDHYWNSAIAAGGMGTVGSKTYLNGFSMISTNCSHGGFCALPTVFVDGVTINGLTVQNSSIALVQDVNHFSVVGNKVSGLIDYGVLSGSTAVDGIFGEGVTHGVAASNELDTSPQHAINMEGSELTVTTTEQLPTLDVSIKGNVAINVNNNSCWAVKGSSFDNSLYGVDNSVDDNKCSASDGNLNFITTKYAQIKGNHAYLLVNGGDNLAGLTGFRYVDNELFDPGTSYPSIDDTGVSINTSLGGYVGHNQVLCDGSNGLYIDWDDTTLAGGTATQIELAPNNQFECGVTPVAPGISSPPTLGAWTVGQVMATFTHTTGYPTAYQVITAGSPGVWGALGVMGNAGTPSLSLCGGATTPINLSTNNDFLVQVGNTGTPTACTVTFSQAFTGTPHCSVQAYSTSVTASFNPADLLPGSLKVTLSGAFNMGFFRGQCQ